MPEEPGPLIVAPLMYTIGAFNFNGSSSLLVSRIRSALIVTHRCPVPSGRASYELT